MSRYRITIECSSSSHPDTVEMRNALRVFFVVRGQSVEAFEFEDVPDSDPHVTASTEKSKR